MSFADGLLKGAKMGYGWVQAYQQGQEWQDEANFRQAIKDADSVYGVLKDGAEKLPNGTDAEKLARLNALSDARDEYDHMVQRAYLDHYGGRGGALYANLAGAIGKTWDNQYKDAYKNSLRAHGQDIAKQEGAIPTTAQPKQTPQPVQHAPAPTAAAPAAPAAPAATAPAPKQANNRYTAPIAQAILNGDPATLEMVNAIAEQNGFKVLSNKKQIMWQPLSGGDPVMADPRMITNLLNRYINVSEFLHNGGEA